MAIELVASHRGCARRRHLGRARGGRRRRSGGDERKSVELCLEPGDTLHDFFMLLLGLPLERCEGEGDDLEGERRRQRRRGA